MPEEITDSITITLPEGTEIPATTVVATPEPAAAATPAAPIAPVVSDSPQDALNTLKKQLEERDAQLRSANEATMRANTERQNFERMARENASRADQFKSQASSASYDSVVNALSSAQAQQENLQQQIAEANEKGEHGLAAKLNGEMSKIGARIVNLEDNKLHLETERATVVATPQPVQQTQQQETAAQWFARPWNQAEFDYYASTRPPATANWLRANARFANDVGFREKVGAAYEYATKIRGIAAESPECFQAIEEAVGMRQAEPVVQRADPVSTAAAPVQATARTPAPAAPPSRNVPTSGRPNNNQITLSPEQRKIAHQILAHVTKEGKDPEVVYAQQLAASIAEGKIGTAH